MLDTEEYLGGNYARSQTDLFGSFVPRMLLHTDLPEVTASIAPRRVILAGVTDAAGKPIEAPALQSVYASARNVELMPNPAWDAPALLAVAQRFQKTGGG